MFDKSKKYRIEASFEEKPKLNGTDEYVEHLTLDIDTNEKYTKPKKPHWLLRRIFILTWIRSYDREMAMSDLIAGITLGMTIIPQSIAYAALAGLSSEYGLYSAFMGSMIYVFFGTIPQVSIGPTSLMALMVLQFCADKPVQMVIVLAFLAGLVELLMGVFQLGFIVNFIPAPVVKAFTTATALIVCLVQCKSLLGVRIKGVPNPIDFWNSIRPYDAMLGVTCLIILLVLRQLSQINIAPRLKKLLWYISISRNFLVVFFCALIAYIVIVKQSGTVPFALSSKVQSGLPSLKLPPFVFEYNNTTYIFTDIIRELGSGIIVVPIVAVLANVAIAKVFVKDGNLDASQEMLTLGLCNLAGSFFSAMPTCGAFTRSAVSQASGVRTPMAGIYTGILVLSALSVLTPYFEYIPKSTLAAVLIGAVIFMIDISPVKILWRRNKKDFCSWVTCFIVCVLAGVELGLFLGIVMNLVFILMRLGNPKVGINLEKIDASGYIHIVPLSDIYYTGVDYLREQIQSACALYRHDFPVVLECSRFMQFDATFIEMLNAISKELNETDTVFVLQNMSLKLQQLFPVTPNVRFCNGKLTAEDLQMPTKK